MKSITPKPTSTYSNQIRGIPMTMAIKLMNPCAVFFFAIHTIAKINEADASREPEPKPNGGSGKPSNGISVMTRASAVQI